jgi:SAM-dependent methyltransferase
MKKLHQAFRVLGDGTRLRMVRLIAEARLNATELVSLVGIAQSSVSHHLAKLKALGLIAEERVGGFSYYALAVDAANALWPLVDMARKAPDEHGDSPRLAELLSQREDTQRMNEKLLEPGQSWRLWASALTALLPPLEVADFGCGSGVLTFELARWAKRVHAIDHNAAVLGKARAEAKRLKLDNINFIEADLSALPLPTRSCDVVVISQSLHHVDSPDSALREASRILRMNGRLLILELEPHNEVWARSRLGHRHLGLAPAQLSQLLSLHGFHQLSAHTPPRETPSPFRAFVMAATLLEPKTKRSPSPRFQQATSL